MLSGLNFRPLVRFVLTPLDSESLRVFQWEFLRGARRGRFIQRSLLSLGACAFSDSVSTSRAMKERRIKRLQFHERQD